MVNMNFRYYELDMHLSLRENLKKKTIIEFPTIYVILKHRKEEFDVIDSGMLVI